MTKDTPAVFRVVAIAAVLCLAFATLTACGDESPPAAKSIPDSKVDRDPDVAEGGPSKSSILTKEELPEGWRLASGQQYLGIPNFCDILLEPPGLSSSTTQRFTKSFGGPFVIQHSFITSKESAAKKRLKNFVDAISTCSSFTDRDDVDWTARPLEGLKPVGTEFGAVQLERKVPAGDCCGQLAYIAFRSGDLVTVLTSYGIAGLATLDELNSITSAISAKSGEAAP